jgi:hypothetical protein
MKTNLAVHIMLTLTAVIVLGFCATQHAGAQLQTYGTPGSPSATTTIDCKQLPPMPDEKFGGKIERCFKGTNWCM